MDINSFIESFEYREINTRKYYMVVLFLTILMFIVLLFNYKVINYQSGEILIEDNKLIIITDTKNLENIVKNKKIIIERTTFTYLVEKIDNLYLDNNLFKKIIIKIDNFSKDKVINNNVIEYKIIKEEQNIFKYLFRIIKGDD